MSNPHLKFALMLFCFFAAIGPAYATTHWDQQLHKDLLASYECSASPGTGTKLEIELTVFGIISADSISSVMQFKVALRHWWTDGRLVWTPSTYGGRTGTAINADPSRNIPCVWVPDLECYNNAERTMDLNTPNTLIANDGSIFINRFGNINAALQYDLSKYPYDKQTIRLTMESWTYPTTELNISFRNGVGIKKEESFYHEHIEWELESLAADMETNVYIGNVIWQSIFFDIKVFRKGNTMTISVIVPGVIVSLLSLLYILLPKGANERLPYLNAILLTEIMFLVMMTQFVPISRTTPIVERLFLMLSVILSFITFVIIIIEYKYKKEQDEKERLASYKEINAEEEAKVGMKLHGSNDKEEAKHSGILDVGQVEFNHGREMNSHEREIIRNLSNEGAPDKGTGLARRCRFPWKLSLDTIDWIAYGVVAAFLIGSIMHELITIYSSKVGSDIFSKAN